jgi:hypothetical protein
VSEVTDELQDMILTGEAWARKRAEYERLHDEAIREQQRIRSELRRRAAKALGRAAGRYDDAPAGTFTKNEAFRLRYRDGYYIEFEGRSVGPAHSKAAAAVVAYLLLCGCDDATAVFGAAV